MEQNDYFGQLSSQFPIQPIRVLYTKAGTNLAATVVDDPLAIIDHKLYWAPVPSLAEAHFLCGLLNSEALRQRVEQYQSTGQFGARDFDKYVFNQPIPRFSSECALHRGISEAGASAEAVAKEVSMREGEHFTITRRRIRRALADHGIGQRLEELASEVLNGP